MHIGIDFSPWPSLGRCNELSHAPTRPCTCPTLCRSDSVSLPSTPCGQHARAGGRGSLDPPWSWVPSFLHSTLSSWLLVPVLAEQSQTCLASCSSWHLCLDLVLLLEAMALSSCRGAECLDVGTAAAVTRFSDGTGGILNGKQVTLNGQMTVRWCFQFLCTTPVSLTGPSAPARFFWAHPETPLPPRITSLLLFHLLGWTVASLDLCWPACRLLWAHQGCAVPAFPTEKTQTASISLPQLQVFMTPPASETSPLFPTWLEFTYTKGLADGWAD